MPIEYKLLSNTREEDILDTHNEAFSDYQVEMQLTLPRFHKINLLRGIRYELSIGAFDLDKLVGFTLNGIGMWNNKLTAYDCGTGVIGEYRNRGIADKMFNNLLPVLLENNITQYLLEVIKTNETAKNLYLKKGFKVQREFDCLMIDSEHLIKSTSEVEQIPYYVIKEIEIPNWDEMKEFWDNAPSWQNSIDSIKRLRDNFMIYGLFKNRTLLAYSVIESRSGGIIQFAVKKSYRRTKIGTILMQHIQKTLDGVRSFHIINIDKKCRSLLDFCVGLGFKSFTEQFEMVLDLKNI